MDVLAENSLTMTAFSPITGAPAFTLSNLISGTLPKFITGDDLNGNVTPFEIGTMTIVNNGTGPGDVTLSSDSIGGNYLDTNFNERNSGLQTVAIEAPVPEPGTLLLLASGIACLAVRRHRAQGVSLG